MRSVTAISSMMGKRNKIYRFSMLLLILVTSCISAEHCYIVPNYSTSQCQNYSTGTCFTLADFASNISHLDQSNNLTISFLPGEHLLTRRLTISGPLNITLTGQNSSNSSTIKCQGTSGFEFGDIQSLNIEYLEFTGCGNVSYGGAISINRVDMFLIKGCHFIDNHVTLNGGAILVINTVTMNIEGSIFNNNSASVSSYSHYGGAISLRVVKGSIFTINSTYMNNTAKGGGAISAWSGNISSTNDDYINNSAYWGGAINVENGHITSTSNHYINNSAYHGGAINVENGDITSTSNHYINNSAYDGGAINVENGNTTSTSNHYINNSAFIGGAIMMYGCRCSLCNDSFTRNTAANGSAIYQERGALEIVQTNITDNFASNNGTLFLISVTLMIDEQVNFMNNRGSLFVSFSIVQINGGVFVNNSGDLGGAITAIQQSSIRFNPASMVTTISNNTATYGGGIYLAQSDLYVSHPFELTDNIASEYGGGIYASQSWIDIEFLETQTFEITNNTALNGGALYAIASTIYIYTGFVDFNSNRAIMNGGAMYLGQNSNISLVKGEPDYVSSDDLNVRLDFTNNSAEKGGAIFVADNTNDGVLCQGANTDIHQQQAECFIQTLKYDHFSVRSITYINTFFTNNTALQSGSDIYGGQLDRCTISRYAELVYGYPEYKNSSGFDYIKATTQIEQIIDYSQYARSHPDYLINNITNSDVARLISSDVILKFCVDNVVSPNYTHPNVSINKGELFTVSVAVIDQLENPLKTTVSSSLSSVSENDHFKGGQVEQQLGNQCTELEYNVYSQDSSVQLHLHLYCGRPLWQ